MIVTTNLVTSVLNNPDSLVFLMKYPLLPKKIKRANLVSNHYINLFTFFFFSRNAHTIFPMDTLHITCMMCGEKGYLLPSKLSCDMPSATSWSKTATKTYGFSHLHEWKLINNVSI